jgi:ATP-dependent DNA helicase RecG
VGTHALLSDQIQLKKVGLVIIDEQHRFGVEQRALLRKKGSAPHLLTMTATPIPRTVALTLYGDLDLSVIDQMPKGRKFVKTHLVPESKREDAYAFIAKKIGEGDQAYIVTPLIDESIIFSGTKAATVEFERLKDIFPNLKLGLLHGRMRAKEKEEVLEKFKNNDIQILVSTTVIEVGMDIQNATIMMIEGAERFGLAQLHQLRGRIGRGDKESFCLLFSDIQSKGEVKRLKHMETIYDGLKLSELDLKMRGGGEIFSTQQHGRFNLKVAKLSDTKLLEKAQSQARKILETNPTLDNYPKLKAKLGLESKHIAPD